MTTEIPSAPTRSTIAPSSTSAGPTGPRRKASIDLLRVLGITLVVIGHNWFYVPGIRVLIGAWVVPLFFLLGGYFYNPDRSLTGEITRRGRALMLPYVFWLVVLLAIFDGPGLVRGDRNALASAFWTVWGGSMAIQPFHAFWFISAMFFLAILGRITDWMPLWSRAVMACLLLVPVYVWGPKIAFLPGSIGLAVVCFVYVIAGRILRVVEDSHPLGRLGALALLVVGWIPMAFGAAASDIKNGNFGTPVFGVAAGILISAGLVLAVESLEHRIPDRLRRLSLTLASAGTVVILVHGAFLALLPVLGSRWLTAVVALAGSWTLGLVLARTRLAPFAVGIPRQSRR